MSLLPVTRQHEVSESQGRQFCGKQARKETIFLMSPVKSDGLAPHKAALYSRRRNGWASKKQRHRERMALAILPGGFMPAGDILFAHFPSKIDFSATKEGRDVNLPLLKVY